jgi:thymidine phosphorylase
VPFSANIPTFEELPVNQREAASMLSEMVAGRPPGPHEVDSFIKAGIDGAISEAQVSAFLMAVATKELSRDALVALTISYFAHDGTHADAGPAHLFMDKHSTGGVGDKLTFLVLPLAAAAGAKIRKLSGTSLGHCRGTIDKLSALPGFRHADTLDQMDEEVARFGFSIGRTSATFCAGDTLTYALRNRCGTTQVPELIAASIMSKKLALRPKGLILDVKIGAGGLFRSEEQARRTAEAMLSIAEGANVPTRIYLTAMTTPLGSAIGGQAEIAETLELLSRSPENGAPICDLACKLAAAVVELEGDTTADQAIEKVQEAWSDQQARKRLQAWLEHRGADLGALQGDREWQDVIAPQEGWITGLKARALGALSARLADGASNLGDIRIDASPGDKVQQGQRLARIAVPVSEAANANSEYLKAVRFGSAPPEITPIVLDVLATGAMEPGRG